MKACISEDKRFILTPHKWPRWPVLPLKRKDNNLANKNLGFIVARETREPVTVYHGYIYDKEHMKDITKLPQTTYQTIDEMLNDSWRVD